MLELVFVIRSGFQVQLVVDVGPVIVQPPQKIKDHIDPKYTRNKLSRAIKKIFPVQSALESSLNESHDGHQHVYENDRVENITDAEWDPAESDPQKAHDERIKA
jgi:hypothetical protein